jgi:tRNA G46 methylase TrmB
MPQSTDGVNQGAYHPESYWSRVANEIKKRGPQNCLAGDDNPFFRYKRQKFLARFLSTIEFNSKVVLEVGPGPGGNLLQIVRTSRPRRVIGIDISSEMLDLNPPALQTGGTSNVGFQLAYVLALGGVPVSQARVSF